MGARPLGYLALLVVVLLFVSCAGSGTLDPAQSSLTTQQSFRQWVDSLDRNVSPAVDDSGLPGIPPDVGAPGHAVSEVTGPVVKLGKDYMQELNGTVDGDGLVLEAPGVGDGAEHPIAYGLYKVEGLTGKRPTSLNVECLPRTITEAYFVGMADYSQMRWRWFGPFSIPEAIINLANDEHRYVSNLGNLYFLVVCHAGNGARHAQTTLLFDDQGDSRLPGAPAHLVASDGQFPDGVGLSWLAGPGATFYQVFRKLGGDPAHPGEWGMIAAEVHNTEYFDQAVDQGVVYCYKVRAGNPAGFSGFSNIDSGFAGQQPPPDGFAIEGFIRLPGEPDHPGGPVPGIEVHLLGLMQEPVTQTDQNGHYRYGPLPPGRYLVVPQNPLARFDPLYRVVEIGQGNPVGHADFIALVGELPSWRIWGFVMKAGDPAMGNAITFPGVQVTAHTEGGEPHSATTDGNGFYQIVELPVGMYNVSPAMDGWHFEPAMRQAHVDHTVVTPMMNFMGFPNEPPPPGPCVIEGVIRNGDGAGMHGILVTLLGAFDPSGPRSVETGQDGGFHFGDLPHGKYIVVPSAPNLRFEPEYAFVGLIDSDHATVEFHGFATDAFYHAWGFVFNNNGDWPNHFLPMGGVAVEARLDGTDTVRTGETNADGFFSIPELAVGTQIITPSLDGWHFDPAHVPVIINGEHVPPPVFFRGDQVP